jgi:predicted metallo-beta-lactamase superfamily hydrolase
VENVVEEAKQVTSEELWRSPEKPLDEREGMFAIRLLPPTRLGPDGQRLGEIVVGDFRETFACHSEDIAGLEVGWRERLKALVEGEPAVVLRHDPRFAWIVYREGADCYVQQQLSLDGSFADVLPRVTTTEDGCAVSEWATTMAALGQFLNAEP